MTDERMPAAEVYEEELKYMPYARSLQKVVELVHSGAPRNARVVDLMCGTGYLLGEIRKKRKDLELVGVDIDPRYVDFARAHYSQIHFEQGDVLQWRPPQPFDVFLCTGALHHIAYDRQEEAVKKMARMIRPEGYGIISDCYIDDYTTELERKLAAAKMGYEYLRETIQNGSTDDVTAVTVDILKNDVMGIEFKTSLARRLPVFKEIFGSAETFKTWPNPWSGGYGDYVTLLQARRHEYD